MTPFDPLHATLLDLLYELRDSDLPLLLGGGYGLYLKQMHIESSGQPSLLEAIPPIRATNDLDVFLRTEVITDSIRLRPLKDALDRLGFTVILSAQNYQFVRKFFFGDQQWEVKIDLLAKTPDRVMFPHIKVDERRIKPNPSVGLHAHRTDEAAAIEDNPITLTTSGIRTNGESFTGEISVPSAYALLMMKLYALRDQSENSEKGFGRKHAIDIYALIALLTEAEYHVAQRLSLRYRDTVEGREAAQIAAVLFCEETALGVLRMKEHGTLPPDANITEFLSVLSELFPEN